MNSTVRRALRASAAIAATVALGLVAASPTMATTDADSLLIDPSRSAATIASWADAPAATTDAATFASNLDLAQRVIDELRGADAGSTVIGGADAFAAPLPASAASVRAHFADFIPAGARLLADAGSDRAVAAYLDGTATLVYVNSSAAPASIEIDLRSFAAPADAQATSYVTDAGGQLVASDPEPVGSDGIVSISAPAESLLTVVTTGLTPAAAQTRAPVLADDSALVGEPSLHLIESTYAPGKVIELGNANAQPTLPTREPAAAAVFTLGRTPAAIQKQALALYPVTGSTDTFVIAAADGRVLARRVNSSADYRYLELRESTIDAAAADPYAQWTVVAGNDGISYIHNAQRDGAGATAALDLYNWATAEASEVQTYTAGTAAVQQWRLRSLTPSIAAVTGVIEVGHEPALPTTVRATYSWGARVELAPIVWQHPDSAVWQSEGTVTVEGVATGYFGEQVPVTAEYTVGTLATEVTAPLSAYAGVSVAELRMRAPSTVARAVSGSETTVTAPVRWNWSAVTDADFAEAGTVAVPSVEGLGFSATLKVDVRPAAQVNILRGAGVHADYTFKDSTVFALTDGVRDRIGFADWRSGGATNRVNPNTVSFYFDAPQQVTGASVFDIGGQNNIGAVTVQYRDVRGGWVDLPAGETAWPYTNPTAALSLEVDGESVLATGIRVVVTNKSSNTWMTLSEIEVRGLAAASAR